MSEMRLEFAKHTTCAMRSNERLAVVLADISTDLFEHAVALYPDRVLNVGIREQLMIGVASGLALTGFKPIVHTYAPFLIERAFEQIKVALCHQDVSAILVSIGASYDRSTAGRTHHAPGDLQLLDTLAQWHVFVPGHASEVKECLRRAVALEGRSYVRLSTVTNGAGLGQAGDPCVLKTGNRGVVIAIGPMASRVLHAAAHLDVTLIYLICARPISPELHALCGDQDVVIVEPFLEGTSVAPVLRSLSNSRRRVEAIGVRQDDLRKYGTVDDHDQAHGLDARSLRQRLVRFFDL